MALQNQEHNGLLLQINLATALILEINKAPEGGMARVVPEGIPGFDLVATATLQYDYLSGILQAMLAGKRLDIADGLLSSHVVVEEVKTGRSTDGMLQVKVDFTGSFRGSFYLKGVPVYLQQNGLIALQNIAYELRSQSFLLNTAKWLFQKKIATELQKFTTLSIVAYEEQARKLLTEKLNATWANGISGSGSLKELTIKNIQVLPEGLELTCRTTGNLVVHLKMADMGTGAGA